jgi:hypothetical protein
MTDTDWMALAHKAETQVSEFRALFFRLEEILRCGHALQFPYDRVVDHVALMAKERQEAFTEVAKLRSQLECIRDAFAIIHGEDVVPSGDDD